MSRGGAGVHGLDSLLAIKARTPCYPRSVADLVAAALPPLRHGWSKHALPTSVRWPWLTMGN